MTKKLFSSTLIGNAEEVANFLSGLLESSTEYSIIGKDLEGKVLLWNEGARLIYGYEPDEIIGCSADILHVPEDVEAGRPRDMRETALREGKWEGTLARLRKNGDRFPARVVVNPRRDGTGEVVGYLLVSKDITGEIRLADALKTSLGPMATKLLSSTLIASSEEVADFLGNVLESSTEYSIIGKDREGNILLWNEGARRLYGYEASEIIGRNSEILHVPEDVEAGIPVQMRETALREGKFEGTLARKRTNGERFTARVVVNPRRDSSGEVVGFLLISKDITEEVRLTEALKTTQFYTRSLIESNIDALMTTDPIGIITDVNEQMEALTGHRREELIGTPFKQYFTDPAQAEAGIRLVLREGKVTNYELTARSKAGKETMVSYNAATFFDRDGKLQGVFAAAREVTERKAFEKTLQEKNVELESAVFAKDGFLASMSHELRTPLNSIIGFTGTLLMGLPGPLTDQQTDQVQTIGASGQHLLSLINDLLDLAKIDSGKVDINLAPIAVQGVVEEVATTLRPLAEKKGLSFTVHAPRKEVVVQTDRRALNQILINIANNAIKFTDKGEVRLEIRDVVRQDRPWTQISVIDTGVGIRAEDQAKIFEAFSRLDSEPARRSEGTGLGLHLSRKLADLVHGEITFTSIYGQGSTFTVTLPK
ncbi:MAG TPA: PAS domain S-box protein [Dehalococcoidia bacterium]|nr:PAS domain S-box protein [Dehalococcoidia bacterium]